MMNGLWREQTVGIVGFGRSGKAVARVLENEASRLLVYDDGLATPPKDSELAGPVEWFGKGEIPSRQPDRWIVSPGVPPEHDLLVEARRHGVPILSELEVGYRLARGPVYAVTGTNGKTSTVHLLGALLGEVQSNPVELCGNCGFPFTTAAAENPDALFIVEVSSFQAEALKNFQPDVTVLTDLGEDHLNRHGTLENYHGLKRELVRRATRRRVVPFDTTIGVESDLLVRFDGGRFQSGDGEWHELGDLIGENELPEDLRRFPQNLAAALAALGNLPEPDQVRRALSRRNQPPFRAESIPLSDERVVVNDSKATNPGAVSALLKQTDPPFRLLLGGDDKELPVEELVELLLDGKPEEIMVAGEGTLARRFERVLSEYGLNFSRQSDWEQAVKQLIERSRPGEQILLAPAGTSYDAFRDYRHRGEAFRRWTEEVRRT